jgi:hypothetical protein
MQRLQEKLGFTALKAAVQETGSNFTKGNTKNVAVLPANENPQLCHDSSPSTKNSIPAASQINALIQGGLKTNPFLADDQAVSNQA